MGNELICKYRVLRSDDGVLGVHETYYQDGKLVFVSDRIGPEGESFEELADDFDAFKEAMAEPVGDYEKLVETMEPLDE